MCAVNLREYGSGKKDGRLADRDLDWFLLRLLHSFLFFVDSALNLHISLIVRGAEHHLQIQQVSAGIDMLE